MSVQVVDFRAKQPRRRFNLAAAVTIPHSPTRLRLVSISLNTGINRNVINNIVKLVATVGVRGVTGIAQLRFRIFRNGVQIFDTQQGVESAGSERNYVVSFQAIDTGVFGQHRYTLTVENMTAGTTAQLVGPLNFSGLSTRRVSM